MSSTKPLFPRPEIQRVERVYVAWVNSDRTEGRGFQVPYAVCTLAETARRLGKGQNVQGCDAEVREDYALSIVGGGIVYVPGVVIAPSKQDLELAKANEEKAKARKAFEDAIERAKAIGLSEEDIKILQGAK